MSEFSIVPVASIFGDALEWSYEGNDGIEYEMVEEENNKNTGNPVVLVGYVMVDVGHLPDADHDVVNDE